MILNSENVLWGFFQFYLILTNLLGTSGQNTAYCNQALYGAKAEVGTRCLYEGKIGPVCGPNLRRGVSSDLKNYIVDKHNRLRQRVALGIERRGAPGPQPQSSKMNRLRWNDQLALTAQTWANQCLFKLDINRNETNTVVPSPTSPVFVGQNLYGFVDTPPPRGSYNYPNDFRQYDYWDVAIDAWYNGVDYFDSNNVGRYVYGAEWSNYAQMMTDLTTELGCAFNQWTFKKTPNIGRLLICNYGPGGNIVGVPMFTPGTPCSECSVGSACMEGLCVPPMDTTPTTTSITPTTTLTMSTTTPGTTSSTSTTTPTNISSTSSITPTTSITTSTTSTTTPGTTSSTSTTTPGTTSSTSTTTPGTTSSTSTTKPGTTSSTSTTTPTNISSTSSTTPATSITTSTTPTTTSATISNTSTTQPTSTI